MMIPKWIIEKKRNNETLTKEEIEFFINGYTNGDIPDYQMAALAMATFFRGMSAEETAHLTQTMINSGKHVDTSCIDKPKVDKHSTGGIGDKVSLILAPLVATCDLAVPMISGRGLGVTGGTLDKLESIPGYRCDLSEQEFLDIVKTCGCCITGQTGQIAPADKKLYALRDVTATVDSIPLIVASIMGKKLSVGMDALVLDVKYGDGAQMKTIEEARELANAMIKVGQAMNKKVAAFITGMHSPLGRTVGNSLEVLESIECLQGKGPIDLLEVTFCCAEQMLLFGNVATNKQEARQLLQKQIDSGAAFEKFKEMIALQGGDCSVIDNPDKLPKAKIQKPCSAKTNGYIAGVNAQSVGRASLLLGAGRLKSDDKIDYAVGISHIKKIGEPIEQDEPLAIIHAQSEVDVTKAEELLEQAFTIAEAKVERASRIADYIGA